MSKTIIVESEIYITNLLSTKLTKDYTYHNLQHTLSVKKWCERLSKLANLSPQKQEILVIAALFHDTGFTETYDGHEEASQKIAMKFLKTHKYPLSLISEILKCIAATKIEVQPNSTLEAIIKDADLNSLGVEAFIDNSNNLRKEWEILCDLYYTDIGWIQNNLDFLEQHFYHTPQGRQLLGKGKNNNIEKVNNMLANESRDYKT